MCACLLVCVIWVGKRYWWIGPNIWELNLFGCYFLLPNLEKLLQSDGYWLRSWLIQLHCISFTTKSPPVCLKSWERGRERGPSMALMLQGWQHMQLMEDMTPSIHILDYDTHCSSNDTCTPLQTWLCFLYPTPGTLGSHINFPRVRKPVI